MINEHADGRDIVIFGSAYCKYCLLAKTLVASTGCSYKYVDLDDFGCEQLKQKLKETNGADTIPIIYKKSADGYEFIGGYKDLLAICSKK